ncbi:hypothetical protein FNJ88_00075 [Chryseobacterium sp. SNU WT5]|uniref:hypothetical protein n=1 Tax=Chryseobacterium sp. SNU WT5 TaxID=2594269 RepID=UPI00117F4056|nr:hypothetical protein [Chryseobacterium sp. SNU WT5]QDP84021.1 hypothetical protein FNJ88_00075 [Chryseobacterium sp. SNU WT5]
MKTLYFIILFFCSYMVLGQSINFNTINSGNVLNAFISPNDHLAVSSSKTAVIQFGNSNTTNIYDKSKQSDLLIKQTGNFNTTLMSNTNSELENKQKVNIEGNNNYIDITGNNSNSKEMQINLKTNDKMIFVRHY